MIGSYPKIYNLGHKAIRDLFAGPVSVDEKVDGSQFSFGLLDGELHARSRSKPLDLEHPDKMFALGVETALRLAPYLIDNWTYRGEYLAKPKHNTLAYDRTPKDYIVLFDVQTGPGAFLNPEERAEEAQRIGLECVPVFFQGEIDSFEKFQNLLDHTSMLGGQKVEGVVIKNYERFGVDGHCLMGKHVSESFKEVHRGEWKERNPGPTGLLETLTAKYKTPARWGKAIEHLRDRGELEDSPRDIGKLIKEAQEDLLIECEAEIKEDLMRWALPHLRRAVVAGFPEWYKQKLAASQFEGDPK